MTGVVFSFSHFISEDIENIGSLKSKMNIPEYIPSSTDIEPDILRLHKTIGARYVGGASLIKMKNPKDGFAKQGAILKKIRAGYAEQGEKVFMMGMEQQAVFQANLRSYANFGGHGCGK